MSRTLIHGRGVWGFQGPVDSVLVEEGRIEAVGPASSFARGEVEYRPVDGWILPGLIDAHIHPGGLARRGVELGEVGDRSNLEQALSAAAASLPPGVALIGHGLDDERLGFLPTRADLDRFDRPVLLYRKCGHVAVANRLALSRAGVQAGTPDPPGGRIGRDPSGEPTGVLEESAVSGVSRALADVAPAPSPGDVREALEGLAATGIVRVGAMVTVGGDTWCGVGDELQLLADATPLPVDVEVFVITEDPDTLTAAAHRIEGVPGLRFGGWKGFADGSLGGRTAALRAAYHDQPDTSGILRFDPERFAELARTAVESGGVPAVHAIGDAAIEAVLDLYRKLRRRGLDGAFRIEHASVMDRHLIERAVDLGVVFSVQPAFAASDAAWLERRLGPHRMGWAYPLREVLDRGGTLVAGSDAPVEPPDPWRTIQAAVEVCGLTWDEAVAISSDHRLTPGAPADLVVISPGLADSGGHQTIQRLRFR